MQVIRLPLVEVVVVVVTKNAVTGQLNSSDPSGQSLSWSQRHRLVMHRESILHLNWTGVQVSFLEPRRKQICMVIALLKFLTIVLFKHILMHFLSEL